MTDDWTDWYHHDGSGCPCVGQYAHMKYNKVGVIVRTGEYTDEDIGIVRGDRRAWDADYKPERYGKVIRYRLHRPPAMKALLAIVAGPQEELERT